MTISDEELVRLYPLDAIDHDTVAHFRGRLQRELLLNRCGACGHWHHPPKPICPACRSREVKPSPVAGAGSIHLVTLLHRGPSLAGIDYSSQPHSVVTVELDEQLGLRFTSTVIDTAAHEIQIGVRVILDWIERTGAPVPVFRLGPGDRVG